MGGGKGRGISMDLWNSTGGPVGSLGVIKLMGIGQGWGSAEKVGMQGRAGQGRENPGCRVRHLASCRLEAKGTRKGGLLPNTPAGAET